MQAFLDAAKVSFREHQRNNNDNQNTKKEAKKPGAKKTPGDMESGYTSSSSPSFSTTSLSPNSDISNKNLINTADNKVGIIDENVDNYIIAQDANNKVENNKTSPTHTSDFTNLTDIKQETGLDNLFPMTDNSNSNQGEMPSMQDAASPFIMPELSPETMMMMPDMMSMMEDSSMMETMMSGE